MIQFQIKNGRRNITSVFFFFLVFLAFSCNQHTENDTKPVITVSILPQKYLVEQLAGDKFEIEVLIPPGASPVTYEPLPRQLTQIKESEVYFQIGQLVFEQAWTSKIKTIQPELEIVNLSENMKLMEGDHEHGDGNHEHVNPHIWMSPLLMKEMAHTVNLALQKLQPENAQFFETNNEAFQTKLDSLHLSLLATFTETKNKSFLIYHPALAYFAKDYGLHEISLEKDGKEPSPRAFAELIDLARKENIDKILVQSQFDKSNATTLAKEIGAEVISINPLSENWEEEIVNLKKILAQE